MIIELPKNFKFSSGNGFAFTSKNMLIISQAYVDFQELMYMLTYTLKDKNECAYCKKRLTQNDRTIDHINPRDLGGPSITNNLCPCCKKCNSEKANMNLRQYKGLLKIAEENKRKVYWKRVKQEHENTHYLSGFDLPRNWVRIKKMNEIVARYIPTEYRKTEKYRKYKAFYKKYGKFPKPVVVDKNGIILDELNIWLLCRDFNIKNIPAIVLENVEIRK